MAKQTSKSLLRTKQDRRFSPENVHFPLTDWSGETITSDRRKDLDRRCILDERKICNE